MRSDGESAPRPLPSAFELTVKLRPEAWKHSLRLLAAARYYLPVNLTSPPDWEAQYVEYLHHSEFELALEKLEDIGGEHSGYAEEPQFWAELLQAAEHMELHEHAALYSAKLASVRNEG